MSLYMKEKFAFFGVQRPNRQLILKQFLQSSGLPLPESHDETILQMWKAGAREMQYLALEILFRTQNGAPESRTLRGAGVNQIVAGYRRHGRSEAYRTTSPRIIATPHRILSLKVAPLDRSLDQQNRNSLPESVSGAHRFDAALLPRHTIRAFGGVLHSKSHRWALRETATFDQAAVVAITDTVRDSHL